jgi:hypothetical protein
MQPIGMFCKDIPITVRFNSQARFRRTKTPRHRGGETASPITILAASVENTSVRPIAIGYATDRSFRPKITSQIRKLAISN